MVRAIGLLVLILCACGDPGLRDRSLMARVDADGETRRFAVDPMDPESARSTSYIGLAADSLANYYVEGAEAVVRFADISTLARHPSRHLAAVRGAMPLLGLPGGAPDDLVRLALGLPDGVTLDPVRPFAFVKTPAGWVGILPSRSFRAAGSRMKALDAIYSVAGDPKLVENYEPGFRKGFHLPGDCSIIASPSVLTKLGTKLNDTTRKLGLDFGFLDGYAAKVPEDIERIDVALRFGNGLRIDVRAAPAALSPTATMLDTLKPATSAAQRWLPPGGTMYLELVSPPEQWENLARTLWRDRVIKASAETERHLNAIHKLLAALGDDAAIMVDLDGKGGGTILLVAHIADKSATESFLGSEEMTRILATVAGPQGHLEYRPAVLKKHGVKIGTITGSISHHRLLEWRATNDILLTSLSVLLKGPLQGRVAIVEDKLCMIMGKRARDESASFIAHLIDGTPADNDHNREVVTLFPDRIAAFSVDLGELYDGCREAAPFWHEHGRDLRASPLNSRIPASIAVTVEGGAFRIACRVRPEAIAVAARHIHRRVR